MLNYAVPGLARGKPSGKLIYRLKSCTTCVLQLPDVEGMYAHVNWRRANIN